MTIDQTLALPKPPNEAALEQELERLRDFFEHASVGMHLVGPDGTILEANRADYEMLGYARDEYVGRNISEFHADGPVIADILTKLSSGEQLRSYEARLLCKDGSIREVSIDSSVHFVEGRFLNTRCITRDITDAKRDQEARRVTEQRFTVFAENLPGASWIKDLDGRYVYANDEAQRIFKSTDDRLYGRSDDDIFSPEIAAQFRANDQLAIATGEAIQVIETLPQPDGLHHSIVSKFPILSADGGIMHIGGIAFDITDRLLAQAALDDKSRQLELMTNSVPALISYVDRDGCYQLANDLYVQWFKRPKEEIIGRRMDEVLGKRAYAAIRPYVEAALSGEQVEYEMLVPYDSGARWVKAVYVPDTMPDGATRGLFALIMDISARKAQEKEQESLFEEMKATAEALSTANHAKDEFLGMVSHELRTPLTTILGASQLLTRNPDFLEPNERRGLTSDIYKESIRLNNIVENLLLMARFDHGQRLELEPIILRRFADRVIQDVVRVSAHKFEVRFPPEITAVSGNSTCIEQVIRNFVSNAEKYSPAGSTIDIEITEGRGELIFSVGDRGPGIQPDEVELVFEPFFRSTTTHTRSGVGIGLSVCKRLIEAMGGRIWAAPRQGGGSIFSFTLSRYDVAGATPARSRNR